LRIIPTHVDCFSHAGTQAWKRYTFVIFEGLVFDDLTEIPGLDSLYCPSGVIKEAQELAAKLWGRQNFLFGKRLNLWNSGAIMTVCKRKTSL